MIANLLKILNSDADPSQISLALGFALVSGLLPFFSPVSLLILLIVFLLRVNLSAYLLGTAFFSGVAYLLDPLLHRIGLAILTVGQLEGSGPRCTIRRSGDPEVQQFRGDGWPGLRYPVLHPSRAPGERLIRRYRNMCSRGSRKHA